MFSINTVLKPGQYSEAARRTSGTSESLGKSFPPLAPALSAGPESPPGRCPRPGGAHPPRPCRHSLLAQRRHLVRPPPPRNRCRSPSADSSRPSPPHALSPPSPETPQAVCRGPAPGGKRRAGGGRWRRRGIFLTARCPGTKVLIGEGRWRALPEGSSERSRGHLRATAGKIPAEGEALRGKSTREAPEPPVVAAPRAGAEEPRWSPHQPSPNCHLFPVKD